MNKLIGCIFCFISAMLMATRYISAAIYESGSASWSNELFVLGLHYVGSPLRTASIVSLVVGILFLIYGLFQDIRKK